MSKVKFEGSLGMNNQNPIKRITDLVFKHPDRLLIILIVFTGVVMILGI